MRMEEMTTGKTNYKKEETLWVIGINWKWKKPCRK